jgi:hypothetical protein
VKTIRKIDTASGVPKERGRFVTRMNIGPRDLRVCWFAASEALVEEAGYSPRRKSVLVTVCEFVEHTTSTKTNNSSSNGHHPEHSEVC